MEHIKIHQTYYASFVYRIGCISCRLNIIPSEIQLKQTKKKEHV